MGKHLLFLNIPAHGHIRPTLPIVAELVSRGHRVTYAVTEDFAPQVKATGAAPLVYQSTMREPTDSIPAESRDWMARLFLFSTNEALAVIPQLTPRLAGDEPDLVVYDVSMHMTGRLLAQRYKTRQHWDMQAVATMPSLVSNEHFQLCALDAPPAVEDTRPPALPELRARFAELSEVYELPDKPVEEFISWMPELCVAFHSRQFQVAGDTFDDRCVFVGPCLADSAASDWTPPAGAGPVVLISLGTSHNDRPEFFTTCVAAFRDTPWHVVLTLGAHGDPDALGELPPNIEAHRWIPHLSVLRYAKACVCQAGMGSTMEALYSGVPLITVPQAVDAEPIAARVADLGVGLLVPPSEVTAERLRDAVAEVVSDEGIAARMREVRQGVREAGGARRAVDEIESFLYTGQR